jgi:hypothetical protein
VQRDRTQRADVVGVVLDHELGGALHDPVDAGGADEHVVRLFFEHEFAGARQRVEGALLQRAELVFAVTVGEVGEHEERQPVRGLLVESAKDPRGVDTAGVAAQQCIGLVAAFPAEEGVQQVHHGPQVPALLNVDLEQVTKIEQAGCGEAEKALLLHGSGLGVTLHDDEPLQICPIFAGYLLPAGLAFVRAEADAAIRATLREEDAPPVLVGRHVIKDGPAIPADIDRSSQIHIASLDRGSHLMPPVEKLRLPRLEGTLQPAILVQANVVGDPFAVVDRLTHR